MQASPLHNKWTIYCCDSHNKRKTFDDALLRVAELATLEDLAAVFAQMRRPSTLADDQHILCARGAFVPLWENCPAGGTWSIRLRYRRRVPGDGRPALIDAKWEQLLFSAVGEAFQEPAVIAVSCSTKNDSDVLKVWHEGGIDRRCAKRIKLKLSSLLRYRYDTFEYSTNREHLVK